MNDLKVLGYDDEIGICTHLSNSDTPEKHELNRGEKAVMEYSLIEQQIKWLMGEILTVIDATIDDERKLKAVKDIIKDKFSNKLNWIYELCGMPEQKKSWTGTTLEN